MANAEVMFFILTDCVTTMIHADVYVTPDGTSRALLPDMKTIARNRKAAIESLFAKATNCVAHGLSNGFRAEETTASHIKSQLFNTLVPGKLVDEGGGRYSVNVHSNLWFTFLAA